MKKIKKFKINKFKVANLNNLYSINGGERRTEDKVRCPLDTAGLKTKDKLILICKSEAQGQGGVC